MHKDLALPLNERDILKCIRTGKRLGMSYDTLATTLNTPADHLRALMLQRGTQKEVMDVVRELRRGRGKGGSL